MKNVAKAYRQAGIKGMSESNGGTSFKKKVAYKSQLLFVERFENEPLRDYIERCKAAKQAENENH
jgi:hypothetical protein